MVFRKLVLAAPLLLAGCGWLGFGSSPTSAPAARPGVDRQATSTGLPAAPHRGGYEGAQPPAPEGRSEAIGSLVTAKGGQKAQNEQREKERAKLEADRAREREERERRAAAEPAAAPSAVSPSTEPAVQGSEPSQPTPAEPAPR
jgi:hypothetical protein